jgi:hypothetical protein
VWFPKEMCVRENFQHRLAVDEPRLDKLGVNSRHASYLSESKD